MPQRNSKLSWNSIGLREKLTGPLAILAIMAAIVCAFALCHLETQRVEQELTSFCRGIAESIAHMAELTDDPQVLQQFVASVAVSTSVHEITVASGEPPMIIATSRRDWLGKPAKNLPARERCLECLDRAFTTNKPHSDLSHREADIVGYTFPFRTRIGASDIRHPNSGAVMVHLNHHSTRIAARTATVVTTIGMMTIIIVGVIGSYMLLKWLVLEPVAAIERVVKARAAGDVTARIRSNRRDELGQLADQFDDMLDALASSHTQLVHERDVQQQLARELTEQNAELIEKRNALEQAEAKFRSLVNNIPGVSFRCLMDKAWTMLFISDDVQKLTGYPPSDFLENRIRTFESVIHPADRQLVASEIASAVADRKSYTLEYRVLHATGEVRWVREKGQAVFLAAGDAHPAYLDGAIFDITDRKQSEEALSHERQRLKNVIEGTSAGTWEWNVGTGEAAFNERWAEMAGYRLNELGPISIKTWESLVHPDDRRRSEALLKDCFAGVADSYSCECRMKHKAGHWVWVHDRGKVVQWSNDGTPLRMAGTHIDITERKQTEHTLRDAMQQLESHKFAIDEHAIVAVTDPRGTITYANDRFCEISGYSRAELIGQDHRLINSGHHPKSFWREIWQTISQGKVWHGQVCNRTKAGTRYWVDATIVPFKNAQGHITQYIAIRTDITRIKTIQAELEQKSRELAEAWEKAESASNAKSEFLANMSHEIRTPLTAMLGYADMLADQDAAESSIPRSQTVATIKRAGEHLLTVVNESWMSPKWMPAE